MSTVAARLSVYDFASADSVALPDSGHRFIYALEPGMTIAGNGRNLSLGNGDGVFLCTGERIAGTGWIFELVFGATRVMGDQTNGLAYSAPVTLEQDLPMILRADAVTSPAGAQTPRHGHQGPGLRRLVHGELLAHVGEVSMRVQPGQAWFESGREWVVGTNISPDENCFVRLLVLPANLKGGQTSFVPASPAVRTKPRAVSYHIFGERDLPPDGV